ncbi:MAG: hemerythrin domain-containing protein [Pseudomonadota bacterium]|nr:hemerythrin domain-containing protein [Pseudomonadota bacterium]
MELLARIREALSSELNPNGILEILKREHQEASALMDLVEQSHPGGRARTATFEKLASSLLAHLAGEDDVLYPALEKLEGTHDMALEAREEHHVIELLVAELRAEQTRGEAWMAKFHVLTENVEHHVREEEEKFFPKSRTVLAVELQVEMAAAYAIARDGHLAEQNQAGARSRGR